MKRSAAISILFFAVLTIALAAACNKTKNKFASTPVNFEVPPGFPQPKYNFVANPLTKEGIELGRKLFYDGKLSKDGNFPCASCHQQSAAFITFDHDLSHGYNNQFTRRNASGLFNLAWQSEFMWDGGINNLEVQPLAHITAPNEMAEDVNNIISKLRADSSYQILFNKAFGSDEINSQRMLKALTQFMLAMVSANSKYDRVKKGLETFNSTEQAGYQTFQAKCASCHVEPLFSDFSYRNNGLTINSYLQDIGRMKITGKSQDSLRFKIPSLRNVWLTYPYMHDGRFWNLSQVFDHYSTGIAQGPTLDPLLANKIPLTSAEKYNLLYFLGTLTDTTFTKDPQFAPPK